MGDEWAGEERRSPAQIEAGHVVRALEANSSAQGRLLRFWRRAAISCATLLVVAIVSNVIGWISVSNAINDADLDKAIVRVDCNSRQAIEDALNQLYQQAGRSYKVDIRCTNPNRRKS